MDRLAIIQVIGVHIGCSKYSAERMADKILALQSPKEKAAEEVFDENNRLRELLYKIAIITGSDNFEGALISIGELIRIAAKNNNLRTRPEAREETP